MVIFQMKQGDTLPKLRATLLDASGAVIPLNGATVFFRLRKQGSNVITVNRAAAIIKAALGLVEFTWLSGDTSSPGAYDADWQITFPHGVQTVPTEGFSTVMVYPAL